VRERSPKPHRSLWVGWTFVPLLNWVAFVYVGIRAKQPKWIFWGLIYLAPWMIPGFNNTTWQWLSFTLSLVAWIASIAHAFLIRKEYLVRLARAKTVQGNVQGGRSTQGPSEGREAATDQPDKGMSPERTHSEAETLDEGGSRQDVGEQPSAPRDYVRTPESGNHVLLPYEELFSVCAKYEGGYYYVGEAIGQKRLTNAHLHFPIPDTERIVALIDTSMWVNGKFGLALCEGGIYWNNGWGAPAKTYRNSLSWTEFASVSIVFKDKPADTVEFGKGNLFWVQKHQIKKDDLSDLFSEVQSLARTHTQEHPPSPTSEEPDTSSDQPPEVSPSQEPVPPLVAIDDSPNQVASERFGAPSIPTNYPLPLAYSYRLADAEFETFRVLKELYRNAEELTAFLASLALVLAPTPTGKRKDTLLRAWRGKGATFGSWYAILEKTTPTIEEEKGHLYRSMQQLLGTKANPSSFAETMTWLIDRRNDLHHGDLPGGPRADLLIQEVRSRFEHCVSESAALWHHPLRLVLDYDAVRNKDYVIATCLDFSGDHPVGRKVQERYQGIPKKQDLYVLQDGKQWISLYPFISVHYCPHCNARETYFVDAWQGSGEEANLRSFERAHEEGSKEIGQELTLRLES
jgi:heme exporter protein D